MEGWIYLTVFLIVMLFLFILLYANSITNSIDPRKCPDAFGQYGVEPGVTGTLLGPNYTYTVDGLLEATRRCDRDILCTSFYYVNGIMTYLENNDIRSYSPNGGLYKRQINLVPIPP
jgi:hypothetical protein